VPFPSFSKATRRFGVERCNPLRPEALWGRQKSFHFRHADQRHR